VRFQLSFGSDSPKGGALAPVLKLALVGLAALVVMNRSDIRRYLRLRRM
jgi:hypothetical protein